MNAYEEQQREEAQADDWRAKHPECGACGEDVCLGGPGCSCDKDDAGVKVGSEYAHEKGTCQLGLATEDKVFSLLASQREHAVRLSQLEEKVAKLTEEHAAFLFDAIKSRLVLEFANAMYRTREPHCGGIEIPWHVCLERMRNAVGAHLLNYSVSPLRSNEPVGTVDFGDGRIS